MLRMKSRSLQFKIQLLMSIALTIALAVSMLALARVYGSIQELNRISHEDFETQQSVLRTIIAYRKQTQEWRDLLARSQDADTADQYWKRLLDAEKDVVEFAKDGRSKTPHEDIRAGLDMFVTRHKEAGDAFRKGYAAFQDSKFDARATDSIAREAVDPVLEQLDTVDAAATEWGAKSTAEAVKRAETGYRVAIMATVITMVGTLVALWIFMRRSVIAPIRQVAAFAERVAQGDLTGRIAARSQDEAGQLVAALGRMNSSLVDVVAKVRASATNVASASTQVAAGTTDLSQRTEEQASALEETAASMEELASAVRRNAENAKEADELARSAAKRAEEGGNEVGSAVVRMNEVRKSAQRISDITAVIDGIAFQTNILALNAAVEAARAGDQGRGFAVVAAEVRALAQRSAQAAKEIKDLIGHSVAEVRDGTTQVEQAGETIQALVTDVKRVSALMNQIAEASAEQSRGVQQVNKTVTQMDKVVQDNASAVQESAAAAQGMRQQAEALVDAVSAFVLESASPSHTSAEAGHAPRTPQESISEDSRIQAVKTPAPQVFLRQLAEPATRRVDEWREF